MIYCLVNYLGQIVYKGSYGRCIDFHNTFFGNSSTETLFLCQVLNEYNPL